MLEIPECLVIARQLNKTAKNKKILNVRTNTSPHRFAFYFGDPDLYDGFLKGKIIGGARAIGGMIEVTVEDYKMLLGDGVNIRYFDQGDKLPQKHQLHIELEDSSSIVCTVQMYGGMWVFKDGQNDNPYYIAAKEKTSPLTEQFDESYFMKLFKDTKKTASVKAFLATEQRIPGLGNGVLQDILFNAGINPKSKINSLSEKEQKKLFHCIKQTIWDMAENGGRDTEKDLFNASGGYKTVLSNKTVKSPCPVCGGTIVRQAYMGGNIYYCPECQPQK